VLPMRMYLIAPSVKCVASSPKVVPVKLSPQLVWKGLRAVLELEFACCPAI